jgi:hypothetical protein
MPKIKTQDLTSQGLVKQSGSVEEKFPTEKPLKTRREEMSFSEERWFFYVRMSFLFFASIGSAVCVSVFLFNLFAPQRWRWLNESDLSKISDLAITIVVGLIMSGATTYFFKKKR